MVLQGLSNVDNAITAEHVYSLGNFYTIFEVPMAVKIWDYWNVMLYWACCSDVWKDYSAFIWEVKQARETQECVRNYIPNDTVSHPRRPESQFFYRLRALTYVRGASGWKILETTGPFDTADSTDIYIACLYNPVLRALPIDRVHFQILNN